MKTTLYRILPVSEHDADVEAELEESEGLIEGGVGSTPTPKVVAHLQRESAVQPRPRFTEREEEWKRDISIPNCTIGHQDIWLL